MWLAAICLFCLVLALIHICKRPSIQAQAGNTEVTISYYPSISYKDYEVYYKRANASDTSLASITITNSSTGVSSAIITQLTNGELYDFHLKARRIWKKRRERLAQIQVTPILPSPANFNADTGRMSASVTLSWSPVPNAIGYEIQRKSTFYDATSLNTIITISDGQTTTYVDKSSLVNGEIYYYRIATTDSRLTSAFSSIVSATPQLTSPAHFYATAGQESSTIVLSWASVANATGYQIQRKSAVSDITTFTTIVPISDGQTMTYVDQSCLVNGDTYNYRIAAIDRRLTSVFSSIFSATPQLTAPLNFSIAYSEISTAIVLSWSSVVNATDYAIQRASEIFNDTSFTTIITIPSRKTTYTDNSEIKYGKTYHYRIAAIQNQWEDASSSWVFLAPTFIKSPYSSVVQVIVPPAPPTNFEAIAGEKSATIYLSWSSVTDAISYIIQRSSTTHDTADFTTITTIFNGKIITYVDTANLVNGDTYYYRIAATDSRLTSTFSPIVSAKPQLTPPTNFKATTGQESCTIVLSWTPEAEAIGYEIQRASPINGIENFSTMATISNSHTTTHVDQSCLVNGETYNYKIKSIDARLVSGFSSIASATPQLTAPTNFNAVLSEKSRTVALSWSTVAGASGYKIQKSSSIHDMTNFITITTISSGEQTIHIDKSGCEHATIYNYKIAAIQSRLNGAIRKEAIPESPFSSIVSVSVPLMPPDHFTAVTADQSATIDLSWSYVTNATGYEIQRTSGNYDVTNFILIATIQNSQTTTYVDKSDLVNGDTYNYRIVVINSRLRSTFSSVVSATPQLTSPAHFYATAGKESSTIVLSWTSVANATDYQIQRKSADSDITTFTTIVTIADGQTMTYADQSCLVNGDTYNYRIAAIDRRLTSVFSSIVSATPELLPPANFYAIAGQESTTISLSWSPVHDATGYQIERSSTSTGVTNFATIVTIVNGQTITYIDTSKLSDGETYNYKILAFDSRLTSACSCTISATPQLTAPTSFNAVLGNENTTVAISWSSVANATGYEIQRSLVSSDATNSVTIATIANGQTTDYIDKAKIEQGNIYNYKIAAMVSRSRGGFWGPIVSKGPFSSTIAVTIPLMSPAHFKAVPVNEKGSIDLLWSCVTSATRYEIQRSSELNGKENFSTIANILSSQTTAYGDTSGLINGETYCYRIEAINSQLRSAFSSIVTVTPQLMTPVSFKAITGKESASIDLSWSAVLNATGYKIERSSAITDITNFTVVATISNGQVANYVDRSCLVNGEIYNYKIAAIDYGSTSAFSSIASAKPQLMPPADFKAVSGQESAYINLSWSAVLNATGYKIERSSAITGITYFNTIATISDGQTTTYIDKSGLLNEENYNYRIAAIDSRLTSTFSPVVSAMSLMTAPANFNAVSGNYSTTIALSWSPVTNASGYEIQRASGIHDMRNLRTIATISSGQTTTYIDKLDLVNGETYNYRIAAIDNRSRGLFRSWGVSKGPYSSVFSITLSLAKPAGSKSISIRKGDLTKENVG